MKQELKKEQESLYIKRIKETNLKELNLFEYLKESLETEKDKNALCGGWAYLKINLTQELKDILLSETYNKIVYNSENVNFILNQLYQTDEINNINKEIKSQLGSFVYVWKDIKTDLNKQEQEQKLKEELLKKGFKEGKFLIYFDKETNEDFDKRREEYYKKLDGLKVKCVMDVSKIGFLGSFDKTEELEGKLMYSEHNKCLMLLPKRSRTRGFLITKRFYYKEIK